MCPVIMALWFDRVKRCVGWDSTDQERLETLRHCLDSDLNRVVEVLGKRLALVKDSQLLMSNARFVQRLHGVLCQWLMGILDARFDREYVAERCAFGRNLGQSDLMFEDVILLQGLVRSELSEFALRELGAHPQVLASTMCALDKALNLDLALIYRAYLEVHDAEMEGELLDRFLAVTGFSRTLYENLVETRGWSGEDSSNGQANSA